MAFWEGRLFPIRERGMNYYSQELQLHEATVCAYLICNACVLVSRCVRVLGVVRGCAWCAVWVCLMCSVGVPDVQCGCA